MKFGSVLTISGQAKIAAALQPGGAPLTITHIALGDGGGAAVVPSENRAELLNEVHRQTIDSAEPHPTDPTTFLIQAVIPPTTGGFWIREIGLYDVDGDLVAYGSFAATEKPVLSSGIGRELIIRTYLTVSSTEAVTIQVDPSFVSATQAWVSMQLVWSKIGEKPDTFLPSAHTHHADDINAGVLAVARIPKLKINKITGLQEALDEKAAVSHTHPISDVVNLQSELNRKVTRIQTAPDNIASKLESGFYERLDKGAGWPFTGQEWFHLISSTHQHASNYYALQFACSFHNNILYFRSTANNGNAPWLTLWHTGNFNPHVRLHRARDYFLHQL